jgi:dihydrofolate reductase
MTPGPIIRPEREERAMRKLISHLFISVDGVVEAPNRFLREDLYQDLDLFNDATIGGQDAVLLGRKTYEEWSAFWPDSQIEPFATFINNVPKYVAAKSLKTPGWAQSHLLSGDILSEIAALKGQPGKTIGVHGSIGLVQSLLVAGLLDELRFVLCPAVAGQGRRLLSRDGEPIQLDLQSARSSPGGLQYLVFRPR